MLSKITSLHISQLPHTWQTWMQDIIQSALECAHMLENDEEMSDDQIALYRECYDRGRGLRKEMKKNRQDHGTPAEFYVPCLKLT